MDVLSTGLFLVCAAVSVAGALLAALGPGGWRALGMLAVAVGVAVLFALLSAGFAAVVELVCGGGAALTVAAAGRLGARPPARGAEPSGQFAQAVATACALALAALAYSAFRGGFFPGRYPGGLFDIAGLGRLLFDRDALAGAALGGLVMAAVGGAAVAWRRRP